MNKEPKDFQETPDLDLVAEIFALGKKAVQTYGETELGNYIISLAWDYQSRIFERDTRKLRLLQEIVTKRMQERIDELTEQSEDIGEEIMDKIDFDKLKKH